ncbi:MAG: YbaB/EbfC family nucleoid-associated protein [Rhodospirillales bacterium]|nr:YbaB/EbfC family nucleoid-associated protein [Rhodospirillales bacterium]MBC92708.1 YbaB/EbfC family nucleoid-associated protein [Rhodospirillaceae bacterium]|tara:strand:+ start:2592 stop:2918 length:327 start_codon:yes stop_codon:yes gene_type:complete
MKNIGQMLKQAQQMQSKMAEMQEQLADTLVDGVSGAGLVKVILNCKGEMKSIKLDPSLLNPSENEILEDLIIAAYADAKSKSEAKSAEAMKELTGGIELPPGMNLPFS